MKQASHVLMGVGRTAGQRPRGQDAASLLHQLDDVLILHHVVLAHFLRVVFNRRAPDQRAKKEAVVQLPACRSDFPPSPLMPQLHRNAQLFCPIATGNVTYRVRRHPSGFLITPLTRAFPGGGAILRGISIRAD